MDNKLLNLRGSAVETESIQTEHLKVFNRKQMENRKRCLKLQIDFFNWNRKV